MEPLGALHDADDGPVALRDDAGICLKCGARVELPEDRSTIVGAKLAGGPPDPTALAPARRAAERAEGGVHRAKARGSSHGGQGTRQHRRHVGASSLRWRRRGRTPSSVRTH